MVPPPLVDYVVARDGQPPPSGLAYDYVLGGDGLYVAARNGFLDVRVPVAAATVRGLPPLYPSFSLRTGRLPNCLWSRIVAAACVWGLAGHELLLAVAHDDTGYRLVRPWQVTGQTAVHYRPLDGVVLEIHSHHRYPARFSPTDDADEQALRVYGVVGRLGTARPEVSLRVGAFGYFMPLPWEAVFEGDRAGVRDAQFEPPDAPEEETDALPG